MLRRRTLESIEEAEPEQAPAWGVELGPGPGPGRRRWWAQPSGSPRWRVAEAQPARVKLGEGLRGLQVLWWRAQ